MAAAGAKRSSEYLDEESEDSGPGELPNVSKKKYEGSAKYKAKYNPAWVQQYPVKAVASIVDNIQEINRPFLDREYKFLRF